MTFEPAPPNKFWALVSVVVGLILLLVGTTVTLNYLRLSASENVLGTQLAGMAIMFVGLICGALALYHGTKSLLRRRSGPFALPPVYVWWIGFGIVLGLGNLLLNYAVASALVFPLLFLLGAALPALSVVAYANRRLASPVTWRQAALALVFGSTFAALLAIILETVLPFLVFLLVPPLRSLAGMSRELIAGGGSDLLTRIFFSPLIAVFLILTAIQAPIPEEFAKGLGITFFGRRRVTEERQAVIIGLMCGAGFAILENMLYEGIYAQRSGWSWGGVTLLRGIGAAVHPLGTALVALGWFHSRKAGFGALLAAYLSAVALHTLWNGGFVALVFLTGLDYYGGARLSVDLYGTAAQAMLVLYLVAVAIVLWIILRRVVDGLARGVIPAAAPTVVSSRALAALAFAVLAVVVPIGAALGPAWGSVQAVVLAGPALAATPSGRELAPQEVRTGVPPATATQQPTFSETPQLQATVPSSAGGAGATWTPTGGCVHDTPIAPASWSVVVCDPFDQNENAWPTRDFDDYYATGSWRIDNGKYRWDLTAHQDTVRWALPNPQSFADFYLTVVAQRINGPTGASYGVAFRRSSGQYYLFEIADDQSYRFSKWDGIEWTKLIDWRTSSVVRPQEPNRLTVKGVGSHFTFFINDEQVGQADDNALAAGGAGVAVELSKPGESATFEFDNFELRAP